MIRVRALTLFWILAAVTGLVLACAGGKEQPIADSAREQPAAKTGGITKDQVEALLAWPEEAVALVGQIRRVLLHEDDPLVVPLGHGHGGAQLDRDPGVGPQGSGPSAGVRTLGPGWFSQD